MRALQTEAVNLNEVLAMSETQAKARYSIGSNTLYRIATEAGANIFIGTRKRLYSRQKLDAYFLELAE